MPRARVCWLVPVLLVLDVLGVQLVVSDRGDALSGSMFKLYEKFSKEPRGHAHENTVRSFRAAAVSSNSDILFHFNLTSIPDSEAILSASLHFLDQHSRHRSWSCRRSRGPSCRVQHLHPSSPVQLVLRGSLENSGSSSPLGNITLAPHRKGPWQVADVSSAIQEAQARNDLMVSVEFYSGERRQDRYLPNSLPYLLVFANDLAITEPNSIAMSLQRYSALPAGEDRETRPPLVPPSSRIRRSTNHLQDNFLPDIQDNDLKHKDLWYNTYFALKPKPLPRSKSDRPGHEVKHRGGSSQELSFDERTMKKARRKQWSEPRVCARRYLRVDFADIGWSEWILAPKAFDAYYCAGTCGFPMTKVVHPSNHATIQSIVRAVGIVPGVPEPCCVPEKMSPLAVLFLDTSRNMVLKVYPSMSVDTCACR
ncbi:growth/differentiation factor 10b [Astyanax mexicanus]|uniref:growth/differentiation factor 10b n=1 Tax=Astyanax mexicanus TaxID=7994 RepID=UPI0020CAA68C|nr:growth/differentiation factor 10b [Astyanax mexicanus]